MRVRFFAATQVPPLVWIYAWIYRVVVWIVAWRLSRTRGVVAVYLRGSALDAPIYGISDLDFLTVVDDSAPATLLRVYDQLDLLHRVFPMVEAGGRTGVLPRDRIVDWCRADPLLAVRLAAPRRLLRGADVLPVVPIDSEVAASAELAAAWDTARRTLPRPGIAYGLYKAMIDVHSAWRRRDGATLPARRADRAVGLVVPAPLSHHDGGLEPLLALIASLGPTPPGPGLRPPELAWDGETDPRPVEIVPYTPGRRDGWLAVGPALLPLGPGRARWLSWTPDPAPALDQLRARYDRGELHTLDRPGLARALATALVATHPGVVDLGGLVDRAWLYPTAGLPSPEELYAVLGAIAARIDRPPPTRPPPLRLSVLVCTRNRAALLEGTLAAIAAQARPADEVVVVDNGSTDATPALLDRWSTVLPLRRVHLATPSIPAARNAAARAATGDILCYTDDDALPEPGSLAAIEAAFLRDERIGIVGGDTRNVAPNTSIDAFFAHHMGAPRDPLLGVDG